MVAKCGIKMTKSMREQQQQQSNVTKWWKKHSKWDMKNAQTEAEAEAKV